MNAINVNEIMDVAVRVWPGEHHVPDLSKPQSQFPDRMLVFDTETTADEIQRLMFGCARLVQVVKEGTSVTGSRTLKEVMFHADSLEDFNPEGYQTLVRYCKERDIELVSQATFAEEYLFKYCVRRLNDSGTMAGTATVVGFNLPFDMSRIAYYAGKGRGKNKKRFTFRMFPNVENPETGKSMESKYRPRFHCESLDTKKALMTWAKKNTIVDS